MRELQEQHTIAGQRLTGEMTLPGLIAEKAIKLATELAEPDSGAHTAIIVGEIIADASSYEEAYSAIGTAYEQEELNLGILRRVRRQMLVQSLHRSKQISDADFVHLSRGLVASPGAARKLQVLQAARERRGRTVRI